MMDQLKRRGFVWVSLVFLLQSCGRSKPTEPFNDKEWEIITNTKLEDFYVVKRGEVHNYEGKINTFLPHEENQFRALLKSLKPSKSIQKSTGLANYQYRLGYKASSKDIHVKFLGEKLHFQFHNYVYEADDAHRFLKILDWDNRPNKGNILE